MLYNRQKLLLQVVKKLREKGIDSKTYLVKTLFLLRQKFKQKYFDWMKNRNLHFIIGTESRFNKFLIIGLYYPPKKE